MLVFAGLSKKAMRSSAVRKGAVNTFLTLETQLVQIRRS